MKYQVQENCLTIFLPGELDHHNAEEIRKESDHLIEHNHMQKHFVTQWWHMDIKPESMHLHLGTRTISVRHGDILCGLHLTALNLPE